MIEKETYYEILESLSTHLEDTSDVVNVKVNDYDYYISSSGNLDSRRKIFSINLSILFYNVPTMRIFQIFADVTTKLHSWMSDWDNDIHFLNYSIKPVSGANARLEMEIFFDSLKDSAKRLLLKKS